MMIDTADPAAETTQADARAEARKAARKKWLSRLAILIAAGALIWAAWYFFIGRNSVSTDNAYVNAETAQVTPLLAASAVKVNVRDTQFVKAGDVLVELDPANVRVALAAAEADLAAARRRFRQGIATSGSLAAQVAARGADIAAADARVRAAAADVEKARGDLSRRESIAGTGAVSGEELAAARRAFTAAQAAYTAAQATVAQARAGQDAAAGQLSANNAAVGGSEASDPGVLAALARLDAARLDLERTVIRAPIDGVVTRRQVQVGQRLNPGVPIMMIVPTGKVYVDANFKERQLRKVRIGMPAEVTADIYGSGVIYHGKVVGIAGGTGSSTAMIPAQNASGNWIKVVQRVPVRIELDPKELTEHPLRVGLSTEVKIDVSSAN